MSKTYKIVVGVLLVIALIGIGYSLNKKQDAAPLNATPQNVTLSGTYECLPHLDTTGPQTEECAFGLVTDEGVHYAVNFGESQNSMDQFRSGQHITAEGFVVIKEALSTDQWAKYNMKGIFTITKIIDPAPTTSTGKLDVNVVCNSALTYMTFPNAASAEKFVTDCKAGKHPEVIEQYKKDRGYGDGAAI